MTIRIVEVEQATPSQDQAPRELELLQAVKGGMMLQHPQAGTTAFSQVLGICGFLNEEKRPLLLLFLKGNTSPFLIDFSLIHFNSFKIPTADKPAVKFRKLLAGLGKFCNQASMERHTHDFVTGKGAIITVRDIPGLCAGFCNILFGPPTTPQESLDLDATVAADHFNPFEGLPNLERLDLDQIPLEPTDPEPPSQSAAPFQMPQESQPEIQPGSTTGTMVCPKCEREQPRSRECTYCGIFVERYLKRQKVREEEQARTEPEREEPSTYYEAQPYETDSLPEESVGFIADRLISIDSLISLTLNVLRTHALSLIIIVVPILFIHIAVGFVVLIATRQSPITGGFLQVMVSLGFSSLLMTAVYSFLDGAVNGKSSVGDSYINAFQEFIPVMWSRFTNNILIIMGLFAFAVPGVIFAVRAIFIEVVGAVGDPSRKQFISLGQISRNLGRGYIFSIMGAVSFLTVLLTLLLYGIFSFIALLMLVFYGSNALTLQMGTTIFLLILGLVVVVTFIVALLCFIYFIYLDLAEIKDNDIYETPYQSDDLLRFVLIIDSVLFVAFVIKGFL